MKRAIYEMLMAAVLIWFVPWFLVSVVISAQPEPTEAEPTVATQCQEEQDIAVKIGNETVQMDMETYLTAVLLAEMPGSFRIEAKMAQAVVARTYALRTVATTDKHPGAVCCESGCCQGFCLPEEYRKAGGTQEAVEEAREAVRSTTGLVLTYNGQLAEATYFACSGGYTEQAVAVWGTDVPYLQAVPSPGEEGALHYSDTVNMTPEDFAAAIGIRLTGKPESWFGPVTRTQGGGVARMIIGGEEFSGTQLRSLLNLHSTAFTIVTADNRIQITSKGHGHRVGMSQYGAQAMAERGCTWEEILEHYYPQTEITEYLQN